jgi:hypothetical protein
MIRPRRRILSLAVRPPPLDGTTAVVNSVGYTPGSSEDTEELSDPPLDEVESDGTLGEPVEVTADVHAGWVALVDRIRSGKIDGMEELYQLFSRGIRFYLCRQLGPQELDDKVHDTFVVVVLAIRRGELREPERLMGFVRTIVRRQVAAHIDKVVHSRREQAEFDTTIRVPDPRGIPRKPPFSASGSGSSGRCWRSYPSATGKS